MLHWYLERLSSGDELEVFEVGSHLAITFLARPLKKTNIISSSNKHGKPVFLYVCIYV